jgi:hypothetical protein
MRPRFLLVFILVAASGSEDGETPERFPYRDAPV